MAAISQNVSPEETVPLLARNVYMLGYEGPHARRHATEFLILLRRYVQQARELSILAAPDQVIRVTSCDDAQALLRVLGYRTRPDCGHKTTFLETADAERAFLTTDSGFPLPALEKTLQGGGPFVYPYPISRVPVLLTEQDWTSASEENGKGFIDSLLHDPDLSRLYHAWADLDPETQSALQQSPGLKRLVPLANSLDFYGSYLRIRSGRVVVPGGARAESEWKDLAGASPGSPGEFVPRLLSKDNGWLAAYFDALSHTPPARQAHFTAPPSLKRNYEALRGKNGSPGAADSVFRPAPELMLLMTRLQWDPNGDLRIPGSIQAWETILGQKGNLALARSLGVRVRSANTPEELLEALFAYSRVRIEEGPCQVFLMLNEVDAGRSAGHRLSPQTVLLMANKFPEFSNQYLIFSEFPELDDTSIALFLKEAEALERIPDHTLRGNAMGIFEANVGLWQILARQGEIPGSKRNESWQGVMKPFSQIGSSAQLFDAGRDSLTEMVRAADGMKVSQGEIVGLLAGPRQTSPEGQRIHGELADRIRAVMDDQRLVSLDTLLALDDGLKEMANGAPVGENLVPLAEELNAFQMPRPIFSRSERTKWTSGAYNNAHTDLQMRTDLTKVLKAPSSAERLAEARGELVPFLRDTLVGFNYAYYEPPGAQALHNNPLLVRSHDFSGETILGIERQLWQTPRLLGAGLPAGGGAHLVGSLADLPYVLSQMEQDFISPEKVQALIWSDLVPEVLTNSILPRWWGVSRNELHAVALYQRAGEELLTKSEDNDELRGKVVDVLSNRMTAERSAWLEEGLRNGRLKEVLSQITPADTFYLTAEFREEFPAEVNSSGPAGQELESLSQKDPEALAWNRLSRDFGVPHPVLARSYGPELLNGRPFPLFEGYSSRLLAENWDSANLYWARLADEMGYPSETLNRLAPELTRNMVAKIFASDLNDAPAILRAMREVGQQFREGSVASLPSNRSGAVQ